MGLPVSDLPAQLAELIGPLTFATREGAPIERIGGLSRLVTDRVSAWRKELPAGSPLNAQADAWLAGLSRYDRLPPAERKVRLKAVLAGLSTLGEKTVAPPVQGPAPVAVRPAENRKNGSADLTLNSGVDSLPGVGAKRVEQLARLHIATVGDLLLHLPARYEDRSRITPISSVTPGTVVTVRGKVVETQLKTTARRRMKIFEAAVADTAGLGGMLVARWFNQAHLVRQIHAEREYVMTGKVGYDRGGTGLVLENPEFEPWEEEADGTHTGRVVPVYPQTEGLTSRQMRRWVKAALSRTEIPDPLPESLRSRLGLPDRRQALAMVHRPEKMDVMQVATRRLAFEEFLFLQVGLAVKKRKAATRRTRAIFRNRPGALERALLARLPFNLTPAQKKVVEQISADLSRPIPMHRLLQGDVGCGKTIVALIALLRAVDNGWQGAIMAPTEVLAAQHFEKMQTVLTGMDVPMALLVSGARGKAKTAEAIAAGTVRIVVGTQALIQKTVHFHKLGLCVIDEQHRFGVRQRAQIGAKGDAPHTLIMTATPIPRSLAMTVYGDLDLSVIDTLPPGRAPVDTHLVYENRRDRVYAAVRKEVENGRQAYVVYPLVEESEKLDLKAATSALEELSSGPLSGVPVGLLHGRMTSDEKHRVMQEFAGGRIKVLVTTTVVEVGVDVATATIMVVEHAERFGLAQLHQLRGRVGRGGYAGRCLLVASHAVSADGKARLKAIVESTDGFRIAERDLEIRGPGELFGQRQSGVPELRVANLIRDAALLSMARQAARELLEADPDLSQPAHRQLKATVADMWRHRLKWGAVG